MSVPIRMRLHRECTIVMSAHDGAEMLIGLGRLRLFLRGDRSVTLCDGDLRALERAASLLSDAQEQAKRSSTDDPEKPAVSISAASLHVSEREDIETLYSLIGELLAVFSEEPRMDRDSWFRDELQPSVIWAIRKLQARRATR